MTHSWHHASARQASIARACGLDTIWTPRDGWQVWASGGAFMRLVLAAAGDRP